DPDGSVVAYAYDPAGNRTRVTTTVGGASQTSAYTFDALNRIDTVTDPDGGVTRYHHDAAGNLVLTEFPNRVTETRRYAGLNRLAFLEDRGPGGDVLSGYHYTLTPAGLLGRVVEDTGRQVDYGYDALGRLTQESVRDAALGDRTTRYTYDPAGNRLTRDDSAEGLTTYAYDANDRLLTETRAGEVTRYTYDDNGTTLAQVRDAADQSFYRWDFANRLAGATVTDAGGTRSVDYQYDADGVRVSAAVGGRETRYLVDTNRPFAQVLTE